ncbi:MAG: hypothetical protein M3N05_06755 [Pseudomonadota bacterium]|nr:hypothetical protein [Pseudomonadota bacterium]
MEAWRVVAAVAASSVIASFTDWLFMGVLFHDRYEIHPEVWREGRSEPRKIILSQVVGVLACIGFVGLCLFLPHLLRFYIKAAFLVWLAASLPMLIQNGIWMKLHPLVQSSHAAGWLARFLITAVVCSFLIPL